MGGSVNLFQWFEGLFFLEGSCYDNIEKPVTHSRQTLFKGIAEWEVAFYDV